MALVIMALLLASPSVLASRIGMESQSTQYMIALRTDRANTGTRFSCDSAPCFELSPPIPKNIREYTQNINGIYTQNIHILVALLTWGEHNFQR